MSPRSLDLVACLVPETTAILPVDAADLGLAAGEYRFFAPAALEIQLGDYAAAAARQFGEMRGTA